MKRMKLDIVRDLLDNHLINKRRESKGDIHVYYSTERPKKHK